MKHFKSQTTVGLLATALAAIVITGCASSDGEKQASPKPPKEAKAFESVPLPPGVTLRKEKHLTGVWLAPGFDFTGKPALKVEPTVYKAIERPNEVEMRAFATKELREKVAATARDSGVFSSVATDESVSPNDASLRLVNTIIEFEKGGGGARYWAGAYGAGQPVLRVRGHMYDNATNLVFVYEAVRSGDSGSARMFGGFRSDQGIQREDIRDLAFDLVNFMKKSAGLPVPD